jgi:uncharacterized membrane protein (UPF0127 family)
VAPRNLLLAVAVVLLAAALGLTVYFQTTNFASVTTPLPKSFTANGKTFSITYTASTELQREHGLMNTKITNTTVMLFAWPTAGSYSFWMYQTNSSLDMIWINATGSTGRIVYEELDAPPCYNSASCAVYTPTSPANYVFEVKAGFAQANGLQVGTVLNFS